MKDCESCPAFIYCHREGKLEDLPEREMEEIILVIRRCFLEKIEQEREKRIFTYKISCN